MYKVVSVEALMVWRALSLSLSLSLILFNSSGIGRLPLSFLFGLKVVAFSMDMQFLLVSSLARALVGWWVRGGGCRRVRCS